MLESIILLSAATTSACSEIYHTYGIDRLPHKMLDFRLWQQCFPLHHSSFEFASTTLASISGVPAWAEGKGACRLQTGRGRGQTVDNLYIAIIFFPFLPLLATPRPFGI